MLLKRLRRGDLRIEGQGPSIYLLSSFAHYGVRALIPRRIRRDVARVLFEYNREREEFWKPSLSLDEFVFGDNEREHWVLLDHKLVRGTIRDVRERLLPRLKQRVQRYSGPGDLIVEFGAGTARNLAYLARELPDRRYLGLELAPQTVDDAREALRGYGLPVEMKVADVTKPVTLETKAAVSFSILALEQLPGTRSREALQQMAAVARRAVVCFEPIPELFESSLRGFTSHLRRYRADYLQGLVNHARDLQLKIVTSERTGLALNPLNEMSELLVELD